MIDDGALRAQLQRLLDWEDAHVSFGTAVEGIPARLRGQVPDGFAHSVWQLVEHLRRTQHDILDFCVSPEYEEPASMDEYWPSSAAPPSDAAWDEAIAGYFEDLERLKALAADPRVRLADAVPNGTGQSYLRELVLVADHTAYHVGQIVQVRRALGNWSS